MSGEPVRNVALVYVRKSLVKKGIPDAAGPELQERLGRLRAAELGLAVELFADIKGHNSGKTDQRKGWQALLKRLGDPDVAAVIIYQTRIAFRNTRHMLAFVDELQKYRIRFVCISMAIDTSTAAGRMVLTNIASADEFESNAASERRIDTIDELRRGSGRHYGSVPFGTQRVMKDADLVLVPSTLGQPKGTDHQALMRAYELYGTGRLSLRRAVMQLNSEGWRWRQRSGGLGLWTAEALRRTLANHWIYAGYIVIGSAYRASRGQPEILKGSHEPILPHSLIAPIAATFAAYQGRQTRRVPVVYPLTGLLFCSGCGQRLQGGNTRGSRNYRHPLFCAAGLFSSRAARQVEGLVQAHVAGALERRPAAERQHAEREGLNLLANPAASDTTEQRRVAQALERLRDLYTWGDLDAEAYREQQATIRASLPNPSKTPSSDAAIALTTSTTFIENASPLELMSVVRSLYARIEYDGETCTFVPREWCRAWA